MTTREKLINAASTESADRGTQWRERLERWLEAMARGPDWDDDGEPDPDDVIQLPD